MIYNLVIYIYLFGVKVAGLFSAKPAKMVKGHREVFDILRNKIDKNARYIWFHAASLGEFEQGRPLIERIRKEHPEYKILQTFFSPSGYEVRKNYQGADLVCYLPFDTPRNVRRFVELANPCMVFFIKYEFWQNYLNELHRRGIPTYSVSSIFRPNQIFFRWYGKRYSEVLRTFAHLFVQNSHLKEILDKVKRPCIRYTEATEENVTQADCLIIDCYGLLSSIYRYGEISYIGGGFGVGIHNVLEAAVYGIPVIFGPNNKKFREAQHLLEQKGGFEVTGYDDFKRLMDKFLSDEAYLQQAGKAAGNYVNHNAGALEKIMKDITL